MNPTRRRLASLAALALLAVSCESPRSNLDPDNPGPWRLSTRPPGAQVRFEGASLMLYTPCELPIDTPRDVGVEISLKGFRTWTGSLGDLPTIASNHFELTLDRVPTE